MTLPLTPKRKWRFKIQKQKQEILKAKQRIKESVKKMPEYRKLLVILPFALLFCAIVTAVLFALTGKQEYRSWFLAFLITIVLAVELLWAHKVVHSDYQDLS
ncbi:MAG: hypothetical protein WC325_13395 [Candidatus Bathyarchaeia archaeon]|jgi:H+/gluconate symporter-like permease